MNRSRSFRRGGKRNFNQNQRSGARKYVSDVPQEQLNEKDVGITEYLSDLAGFSGILKARYSDFHVNEINREGEIAKFSTTEIPSLNTSTPRDGVIPKESPCEFISQEKWDEIATIVDDDKGKIVELDISDVDKDTRGKIHRCVKEYYKRKICASTIERDGKKYIEIKKFNKEEKFDDRVEWTKGDYVHFLVYKENMDTLEAAMRISSCLNIKPNSFTYAGVKDRRGKTTQWFCVKKVEPWKLFKKTKCIRNLRIGNVCFKDTVLKLGDLTGNRFRIALRNITVDDQLIEAAMKMLEERGFINYYGLQRFGHSKEVPTYDVGIKLILGQFKEACELILKCKKHEDPNSDISKARNIYNTTKDAEKACAEFSENENTCLEHKLLVGLSKVNKNDYVTALENIPRNMRLLYLHSFQALIWNKMCSIRIKEFGLKPIVGDLVFCDDEEEEIEQTENEEIENNENNDQENKVEENNVKNFSRKKKVKLLTNDDLVNYNIYDVILPLPGYDVKYPNNKMAEYYKETLESYGLSVEMSFHNVKSYCLSGTYRKLLRKVNNLSWKIMKYDHPNTDLIRSDFDEYQNRKEPEDDPNGAYKALIIDFCLKSSSYATMVIREILKTDTSTTTHIKLNDYHKNTSESVSSGNLTIDGPAPDSLLSDPDKYEEFKRSIFGDGDSKRKLEDETEDNNKKIKID
nr:pseudouridylate synthase 7 homolog [Onthophagus taurus]